MFGRLHWSNGNTTKIIAFVVVAAIVALVVAFAGYALAAVPRVRAQSGGQQAKAVALPG